MDFLFLLAGIIIGGVIGWFVSKSTYHQPQVLSKEQFDNQQSEISRLQIESAQYQEATSRLQGSLNETKQMLDTERENGLRLTKQLSEAQTDNRNLKEKIEDQKKEIDQTNSKLTTEFKNIANIILEEKSRSFTEHNKLSLDSILNPLKDRIEEFKKQVETTYEKESRDTMSLKDEVRRLAEQNIKISEDANNLTRALKGNTKTQGNWGEFVL